MRYYKQMEQEGSQPPNRPPSLNPNRFSNRKSNDSFANLAAQYTESTVTESQKMSLESNISSKAKDLFNKDLFENLAHQECDDQMREEWQELDQRRSGEPQKMSVEAEPASMVEQEPIRTVEIREKISCKCSKSKCLLMYCECFSKGIVCSQECTCYQCRNNAQFQEKRICARKIVLQRDPSAFMNKFQMVGGDKSELAYKRGCNCKRTNCFKKYCECYFAGVKCTYLCNCDNCMNGGQRVYKG